MIGLIEQTAIFMFIWLDVVTILLLLLSFAYMKDAPFLEERNHELAFVFFFVGHTAAEWKSVFFSSFFAQNHIDISFIYYQYCQI